MTPTRTIQEFKSLGEFGLYLGKISALVPIAMQSGLDEVAEAIETEAKAEIGHYQREIMGQFAPWEELKDSTKLDRVQSGFTENDPLLRTGALRDSISHEVSENEAVIGSDSDIMIYQELGTDTIPPRAVLGPAAYRNKDKINEIIGDAIVEGVLMGKALSGAYKIMGKKG